MFVILFLFGLGCKDYTVVIQKFTVFSSKKLNIAQSPLCVFLLFIYWGSHSNRSLVTISFAFIAAATEHTGGRGTRSPTRW